MLLYYMLRKNKYMGFLMQNVENHIIGYGTPINFNYFYSFGSLLGITLGIQILTGIFLAMNYTPHIDLAFESVERIMRDVSGG